MSSQILDGIRIVDLAQGMAGPVAAMMLAESGADVIKVEPPGGDPTRGKSGFAVWNRSKRGLVLDLETEQGRSQLEKLLQSADFLIHDRGPAAAAALGLDDATLGARYPQLIVCSIPAFPVSHPDADRPAKDTLVLARSGILDEQQAVAREGPTFLRVPLCSIGAWHLAAAGVVARLIARQRDGIGGPAHTSLLQGALIPMTMHWATAERPTQSFARGMPKNAGDSLFRCGDGQWIHLMANPDASPLMREVFAEMGEDGVERANARHVAGQMGASFPNFGANVEALESRPREAWLGSLWASDVPVQPCLALGELYFDEQAKLNSYVVEVDDPERGKTRQPGHPYTTTPDSRVKGPAPTLGQHSEEILAASPPAGFAARGKSSGKPPLEGLKVLDFGNFLAGPLAPMLMADLGAQVIKLEATTGDMMRFAVERVFSGCQRGKRGIALNLKDSETRPVVEKLVEWADVVHHNLRYPAARRLRIDYDSLKASRLARIRSALPGRLGLGVRGRGRRQPAHVASLRHDGPPERPGLPDGDVARGLSPRQDRDTAVLQRLAAGSEHPDDQRDLRRSRRRAGTLSNARLETDGRLALSPHLRVWRQALDRRRRRVRRRAARFSRGDRRRRARGSRDLG